MMAEIKQLKQFGFNFYKLIWALHFIKLTAKYLFVKYYILILLYIYIQLYLNYLILSLHLKFIKYYFFILFYIYIQTLPTLYNLEFTPNVIVKYFVKYYIFVLFHIYIQTLHGSLTSTYTYVELLSQINQLWWCLSLHAFCPVYP